ncbi:MAG: hypothetical protein DMD88_01645 [Candidatus Rokuibacteriota bacterium]|nr:MAG: hypothetical protein DMD88_01645 [Candidatus Rokubacteria bacterium]
MGRVRRGAPVCRLPRSRDAGDRARPGARRCRGARGTVLPPRRRADRSSPVHRAPRARAGRGRRPADARARGPGALLRDARQSAAPGGGARRIASHPVARGRGPGAPGGAPDRARRARSRTALAVPLELRDRLRGARPQGLTVLAYYSVAARQEFWTEHWGGHSVEELLAVARRSPLTGLITRALPADGVILEAGCGLGQYVLLLREQGWRVAGVDWSVEALAACRRVAPAPLAAMELRSLAIRDASLAAYVSLGVVEHDADGPDAILAEARRVLAPGGVLVVSVPYVNGARRLGALWIRRRSRALARSGGEFYQYAFSRAELTATLARHGFVARSVDPYDPARLLRQALRRILPGRSKRARPGRALSLGTTLAPEPTPTLPAFDRRDRPLVRVARALLYTEPALRLLGHMLLVVARKA